MTCGREKSQKAKKQENKVAVIYARYSSERQNEQSIEEQLRVINQFAENNDKFTDQSTVDAIKSLLGY